MNLGSVTIKKKLGGLFMNNNENTYNEEKITTLLGQINTQYRELKEAIGTEMQNQVLDKLAEVWYMPAAVTYWAATVPDWNNMCTGINGLFSEIYDMINTCATRYATSCEATWNKRSWTGVDAKVSSNFKQISDDGRRGITDQSSFDTYRTTNLQKIGTEANTYLLNVLHACEDSGFIDGTTQEAIKGKVTEMNTSIKTAIENMADNIVKNSGTAQTNLRNAANIG